MTTPIVAGMGVAAVAMTGRAAILAFEAWKTAPPRMRKFYEGGFEPEMTRREAALILGVRESAAKDKVMAAHRKVMIANHPDAGGSDYIATKINEAKAKLLADRFCALRSDVFSQRSCSFEVVAAQLNRFVLSAGSNQSTD